MPPLSWQQMRRPYSDTLDGGWTPEEIAERWWHAQQEDVFTDAGVPADRRPLIPLVTCGDEIVWVPGGEVAVDRALEVGEEGVHIRIEETTGADAP